MLPLHMPLAGAWAGRLGRSASLQVCHARGQGVSYLEETVYLFCLAALLGLVYVALYAMLDRGNK